MMGTFVLAVAAAVVLALGTYDARLLRLGLVAALWAALFGAFAAARMRRDSHSCADRVDQLRTVYQLELEREVAARKEHTLTVERELREQVELSQRREIVELRAELAAMRANLEQWLDGSALVDRVTPRAELTRNPTLSHPGPELRFGPGFHHPSSARRAPAQAPSVVPAAQAQRTVSDLLAAHGTTSPPRRRRNHNGS
jgi:hypothetical protein